MYFIESGGAVALVHGAEVCTYGAGAYFGERGLLHKEPRAATVVSKGTSTCLKLGREAFERARSGAHNMLELCFGTLNALPSGVWCAS